MSPVEFIRSRSRQAWIDLIIGKVTDLRIWVQENGEKAAAIFFFVGIAIVILFKLVVFLIVISVLVGFSFWYLAPESAEEVSKIEVIAPEETNENQDTSSD